MQKILLDKFPWNFYIWSAIVNDACMQKIKIGHRANFRAKYKCFPQILFPVRAILRSINFRCTDFVTDSADTILVPRGRAPFGQHQESRPLAKSNTGNPRFTDFPSLCACSESCLTNLIGFGLNLLYLQSHSKTECRWTRPEVAILGADQKERGLWGREWADACILVIACVDCARACT